MGVWGGFILKPPSEHYPNLPELEDLTMQLAKLAGLATVPHTLIPLASGELSYLTRRIDRKDKQKFHTEDMCQLTERMTEAKYRGSYEQIAKVITKYSERPLLDLTRFYEVVLYCFLTGNNDMHLKNFSMIKADDDKYQLSPAYDLVAAELVVEDDDEEMALTLNGKKKRLKRKDFIAAMRNAKLTDKSIENIFQRFSRAQNQWVRMIDASFLPKEMKAAYQEMILKKMQQLDYLPLSTQPVTDNE